jgi:type I restriction enzyme S subunit
LSCKQFEAYFEPILTGVSVPHISPTQILDFGFRFPSPEEQAMLCKQVNAFFDHAHRTQQRIEDGIDRLHEYRTALISAAVTGQIDVREEVNLDD